MSTTAVPFEALQHHKRRQEASSGKKNKSQATNGSKSSHSSEDRQKRAALNRQLVEEYRQKQFLASFTSTKSVALHRQREAARAEFERALRKKARHDRPSAATLSQSCLVDRQHAAEQEIKKQLAKNKTFQATLAKLDCVYKHGSKPALACLP